MMISDIKKLIKQILLGMNDSTGLSNNKNNRDNWLAKILHEIPEGSRILDAGAGELRNKPLCSHLNYVSQDFGEYQGNDPDNPRLGSRKIWDTSQVDIICDITNIPEPDESFDAILCSEVFEHLPNPILAFKELTRLLKPKGRLIITSPFCSITHQSPYFYQTGFSRFFYDHWCNNLGLQIIELENNGNYFDYLAQELNRLSSISNKYSKLHLDILSKISKQMLLGFLKRCSYSDSGSDKLLCFGFHLIAEKKIKK